MTYCAILENRVILIDKPVGITSFDVIKKIKRITGIKKIGHSGTLDRLASGLLVVCTGKATRLAQFFIENDKSYEAVVRLGCRTDTDDSDGTVIDRGCTDSISREEIVDACSSFVGRISQIPPLYSALKHNGVRASDIARKGMDVERREREVHVYSLDVTAVAPDMQSFGMRVFCSKGTYIRALARDIGDALGTGAYLESLKRVQSGQFFCDDAVTLEELDRFCSGNETKKKFIKSPAQALGNYSVIVVNDDAVKTIMHGGFFKKDDIYSTVVKEEKKFIIVDKEENLIAIADIDIDKWHINYNAVLGLFN